MAYKCGNGPDLKTVNVTNPAWGKTFSMDCTSEFEKCNDIRLTLTDNGNLVLTYDNLVQWQSNTNSVGIVDPDKTAAKGKNGRNYLKPGEFLSIGEFIGSPSGNCYLIMEKDAATQKGGLRLKYSLSGCDAGTSVRPFPDGVSVYRGIKPDNSALGKTGFVSVDGKLHDYPSELLGTGTTFSLVGNYNAPGNDLVGYDVSNVEQCQTLCRDMSSCAGVVFKKVGQSMPLARYVRLKYPTGMIQNIQISQLAVFSNGRNVAKGKQAHSANRWQGAFNKQANTISGEASIAVDGVLSTRDYPSIYHSVGDVTGADFWEVDLGDVYPIERIEYYNRKDCCQDRAQGMQMLLLAPNRTQVFLQTMSGNAVQIYDFKTSDANCKLKSAATWPTSRVRYADDNYELYVRNKSVNTHSSCSKVFEPITTAQWNAYTKADPMTSTMLCGVQSFTAKEKEAVLKESTALNGIINDIKSNLERLNASGDSVASDLKTYERSINTTIDDLQRTTGGRSKYAAQLPDWDGLTDDSALNMASNMYKNIGWSILAVMFIIGANHLTQP